MKVKNAALTMTTIQHAIMILQCKYNDDTSHILIICYSTS